MYRKEEEKDGGAPGVPYPQVGDQLLALHLAPSEDSHVLGVPRGPAVEKQCPPDGSLLLELVQEELHLEVWTETAQITTRSSPAASHLAIRPS